MRSHILISAESSPDSNTLPSPNGGSRDWDGGDGYRGRGGGRGRGRGRGRGGHQNTDWDDRRDYSRDRDGRRGRHDDDHVGRGGRGGGYNDRYDSRGGYVGGGSGGYGNGSTPSSFAPPMNQPQAVGAVNCLPM